MAESLKARVGRVIAGSVHALLDRIEDQAPEAMMEQAIRDADAVVADVRHELGQVSANRHLSQQRHASLNGQHATLAEQIEQALAQSREDLTRAAVARQLDIEAQLPVLEGTLADWARQESELQGYVAALLAKKREMEEALSAFRKSRAAQASPSGTAPGAAPGKAEQRMGAATGAFDRLYERHTGLSGTDHAITLEQSAKLKELDDLARENKIAERIARLKAGKA
jgi:phage shock protein A